MRKTPGMTDACLDQGFEILCKAYAFCGWPAPTRHLVEQTSISRRIDRHKVRLEPFPGQALPRLVIDGEHIMHMCIQAQRPENCSCVPHVVLRCENPCVLPSLAYQTLAHEMVCVQ